ncbi:MAG: SIS domain-containing protein, partial [Firmicutes bacterium]|nr:SIS domain-containing protein [Bacillota bacterium]
MDYKQTLMYKEILEDGAAIRAAVEGNADKIRGLVSEMRTRGVEHIILAARGSSDHACIYFKYLFEIVGGLPCAFAAPSVVTAFGGVVRCKNALVLGVSQSGKAEDIIAVVEQAKAQGALVAAVTNDEASPLAAAASVHLYLGAGKEQSVAATKTFIAQMAVLAALAAEYSGRAELKDGLKQLPGLLETVFGNTAQIEAAARAYIDARDCYVLAR